MPYVTARDGAKLHVRVIGKGKPVVMLHGFAMNSLHWMPYVLPLSRRYQFIMPDMRGFGGSHAIHHNNDCILTNYVEDLDDILDELGLDDVALAGLSMGAFTGLQFHNLTGFERVNKYLHIDQAPRAINSEDWSHGLFGGAQGKEFTTFRQMLSQAESYGPETRFEDLPADYRKAIRHAFSDFVCYAMSRRAMKWMVKGVFASERLASLALPTENWFTYVRCMRAYVEREYDMRESLTRMSKPMTVMVGMKSQMYPAAGQMHIKELVPHAEIMPFHRSGHVPFIDQPVNFVRGLKHFLDS